MNFNILCGRCNNCSNDGKTVPAPEGSKTLAKGYGTIWVGDCTKPLARIDHGEWFADQTIYGVDGNKKRDCAFYERIQSACRPPSLKADESSRMQA